MLQAVEFIQGRRRRRGKQCCSRYVDTQFIGGFFELELGVMNIIENKVKLVYNRVENGISKRMTNTFHTLA